jgi:hypothetical protein
MTKHRDTNYRLSFVYQASLPMMVAVIVFSSLIHYGYSQKSDSEISILSSSSYTDVNEDDELNYHVVGEVKNNSPTDSLNNVKIVSTFYDSAGKVIGTDFIPT